MKETIMAFFIQLLPRPFPWRWLRWMVDRESVNLVDPFMPVTTAGVLARFSNPGAWTVSSA